MAHAATVAAPSRTAVHTPFLTPGTRIATAYAVLVAQVGLAIPAVLNGLFQENLHTTSAQLTWISDAFLVPVALLELTFGVLGDLFGRRRLLIGGGATKIPWGSDPTATWRWAFVIVAILALISTVLAFASRNSSAPEGRSLDWPGQITIAISLFALLFAVIQGSTSGFASPAVVWGWIVAPIFFVLFLIAEHRSPAPLLRLNLFRSTAFSVNSVVTLVGMFAFLGTAYATSIRLAAIQGFTPLKTSVAFVLLQGFALVLMPLTAKVIHSFNPRWALGGGFLLIGAGDIWLSTISAADRSILPVIPPLAVIGIGFAFALSSVTAVAVNTVPGHLAGMASGTTSQLRDFGFTLGPAVIGAVALSTAAATVQSHLAASRPLRQALAHFSASAPPEAVGAVHSGPLGANAIPGNPLQHVAFQALDSAYSLGYVICGIAALVAALLAAAALRGTATRPLVTEESLED